MNPFDVYCRNCGATVGRECTYPDGTPVGSDHVHRMRAYDALVRTETTAARVPPPRDSESEPFFGGFTT